MRAAEQIDDKPAAVESNTETPAVPDNNAAPNVEPVASPTTPEKAETGLTSCGKRMLNFFLHNM